MKKLIAIDPGAGGGIAWSDRDGNVHAVKMPDGMSAQADFIRGACSNENIRVAVLERVGTYMPGNSGPAAATFARHCGHLDAILYMLSISVMPVAPGVWMKSLGAFPKEKKARKDAIKELMARTYPYLNVTLATADALGMLTWAIRKGI
jgi:hypothetical protein